MSTRYHRNPDLKTIKFGWPGNKIIRGMFANGDDLYLPSFWNVLRWKFTANPQKTEKANDRYCPPIVQNPEIFTSREDAIVWLGHATFLIRVQGITFLTDPVLYNLPFIKRRTPLPCPTEAIRNIDYILLSHGHRDHLDEKSLQLVCRQNPQAKALVPLAMSNLLRKMVPGLTYQEAGWYQQYNLPPDSGVAVFYLPAAHWHRRGLNDMNKVLWGSFMLKTPDKLLYFAGDSAYNPLFTEIKELFGPPDIAILPVGAYKPAFMMQQSHMKPTEAVKAFHDLGAKTFIPMHYGTFDLADEPAGEPVRQLQEMAAANQISGSLILPAIGKVIPLRY